MDINIRKAVIDNIKNSSKTAITDIINDAAASDVETVLPGLGVMFEVLWKNSPQGERQKIVDTISCAI